MKMDMHEEVEIPSGVTVSYTNGVISVQGEKGSIQRDIRRPKLQVLVKDGVVVIEAKQATQREKRHIFTMRSHIRNMIKGSQEGHNYKLKICSGHFPMNVSISNGILTIKNFLGEAVPRTLKLKQGADVKVNGDVIEVSATSKEIAGQQAADIEQLTRITNRDRRIFQDGVFIIEKDGKEL